MKRRGAGPKPMERGQGMSRPSIRVFRASAIVALCSALCGFSDAPPPPATLVANAEAKVRGAKTLTFRVLQRYTLEGLSTHAEEGEVFYAQPNLLRWTYLGRERKVFVSDGKRVYFHLPAQNVVHTSRVRDAARSSPLLGFLFRNRPLGRDFDFVLEERAEDGAWIVSARPRSPRREESLLPFLLHLSEDGEFRRVAWLDGAEGLMEIHISDVRYNPPLDPALFRLEIPVGAEIIEGLGFDE